MERAHIEACILNSDPMPRIASQFGLSVSGIQRHKANCGLVRVSNNLPGRSRIDVVANLLLLAAEAQRALNEAGEDRSHMARASLIGRSHDLIKAIDEAQGQETNEEVPLARHPEWIALRRKIVEALQPFPEASSALVKAMGPGDRGGS